MEPGGSQSYTSCLLLEVRQLIVTLVKDACADITHFLESLHNICRKVCL